MSGQLVDSTPVAAPGNAIRTRKRKVSRQAGPPPGSGPRIPPKHAGKTLMRAGPSGSARRRRPWTAVPRQGLPDKTNTGSGVRADSAYRSKQNEAFPARHGFVSHAHHRKPGGRLMPKHIRRGNKTKSKHRAPVEHVFAVQKHMMGMAVRTIGPAHAKTGICMTNIACNIRRLVQLGGSVTPSDHRTCPFNSNQERSEGGARRCIRNTRPVQMTTPRQNHRKSDEQTGLIEVLRFLKALRVFVSNRPIWLSDAA